MSVKTVLFAAACVVAAVVGLLAWSAYALVGDRALPKHTARVVIPRGSNFRDIADTLARDGVIGNETLFRIYARLRHADRRAHAGEFTLSAHETAAQVLAQIDSGGAQTAKWVTIPEGYTAAQIAARLAQEGFGPASAFDHAFMHDTIVVDGTRTKNLEGYLFPSTYLIPLRASPRTVEAILTQQFFRELPPDAAQKARALGLTVPQAIAVASLIEREAKADDERGLMAGVYYNRLRIHMPLEVDASIEYALPHHQDVITYKDLKIDSPYNTYLRPGLPPTPIANPGEPSILAALNPRPSKFLYYVYKGGGHHAFATTLAQQNANVARYLK